MAEPLLGIDVSTWNNKLDWDALKKQGVQFAIVKATQGKGVNTTANMFTDSRFKYNLENATAAGIYCGVYHYLTASTIGEAAAEADYFISVIKPYKDKIVLWAAVDVEEKKYLPMKDKGLLTRIVNEFCRRVNGAGFRPCIYTNRDFLKNYLNYNDLANWDIWRAHWSSAKPTDYAERMVMWQYTGSGRIQGFNGYFDMNYGYFDIKDLIKDKPAGNISTPCAPTSSTKPKFKKGQMVKVINTFESGGKIRALTYQGTPFVVAHDTYEVIQAVGDRVVIGKNGVVVAAVKDKDLKRVATTTSTQCGASSTVCAPTTSMPCAPSTPKSGKLPVVGSKVRVREGAKAYNGVALSKSVYTNVYYVRQLVGDRAVISPEMTGAITAAVKVDDLIVV